MLWWQSAVLCALFTVAIVPAQVRNPMAMIASYPPAIRRRVESLPAYQETAHKDTRRHILRKLVGVVLIVLVLVAVCWASGMRGFSAAFCHTGWLCAAVNAWDLIVLDWLWFPRSKRARIPGTEDMERAYHDPWFHLRGFGKGVMISIVISLLTAGVVALVA